MKNPNKQIETKLSSGMLDIQMLRNRVRQHNDYGAISHLFLANPSLVIRLLNEALATELVCVLRYRRHYFMAQTILSEAIKAEFLLHANEELKHADRIAKRIVELGGEPDFSPEGLIVRSHAQYIVGDTLRAMIKENLMAEQLAIKSYKEMIAYLEEKDPTTQRLLLEIVNIEEEHAAEMKSLLETIHQ